ncbi:MAG TPA: hypothetical protein PKH79_00590, partial [Prolixibacteraceae bacterium]|nr:hypothetical protein [Prolixibacteraceae bacterium]
GEDPISPGGTRSPMGEDQFQPCALVRPRANECFNPVANLRPYTTGLPTLQRMFALGRRSLSSLRGIVARGRRFHPSQQQVSANRKCLFSGHHTKFAKEMIVTFNEYFYL